MYSVMPENVEDLREGARKDFFAEFELISNRTCQREAC
jgi:hypothetical protein